MTTMEKTQDPSGKPLDPIDHVALSVEDVPAAVAWYRENFACRVLYEDPTWAFLEFANLKLALVIPGQHPPHLALVRPEAVIPEPLKTHRDGTRSVYRQDPSGNTIELMAAESLPGAESAPFPPGSR